MKTRKRRARKPAPATPPAVTKPQRSTALVRPGAFVVRPSFFRYLRAYAEVLEDEKTVNYTAIAKRMGVSRENLWRLRRRHPGLDAWIHTSLHAGNEALIGPVVRRMALIGMQGSHDHAELFLKYMAGGLNGKGEGTSGAPVVNITVVGVPDPAPAGQWPGGYLPDAKRALPA